MKEEEQKEKKKRRRNGGGGIRIREEEEMEKGKDEEEEAMKTTKATTAGTLMDMHHNEWEKEGQTNVAKPERVPPDAGTYSAVKSTYSGSESQIFAQAAASDARFVFKRYPEPPTQLHHHLGSEAAQTQQLLRINDGHWWVDSQGTWLPGRVAVSFADLGRPPRHPAWAPFSLRHGRSSRVGDLRMEPSPWPDLRQLPELSPPVLMPSGNAGTPLRIFWDLIPPCRLPPGIISQLQLQFPKTGSSCNVSFQREDSEWSRRSTCA
ncbi:G patch domain-containing protein 3 [Fukomys damarensis]|uniref:G patch domain-containing protein 3 n=1 Tax=Fukomys damarensis TaxID=885580 RepID=A0A091DIU5_FUKDA|nr:G patch domain-containing protein 3 [Fukomys damarensis]